MIAINDRNDFSLKEIRFFFCYSKLIFFIIAILPFSSAFCQFDQRNQSFNPPPNSASITRLTSTEVNLYSGVPAISSDLHALKARDYSVPINLIYNASGIKVQDVASNIGLGWAISTNCLITRVVNGLPDEDLSSGYFGSDMGQKILGTLTALEMEQISNNEKDTEPDIFYFNINGETGKFVFNKDKTPLMLEGSTVRVLNSPFKKELGVEGWILINSIGHKFYLGSHPGSIENTSLTAYFKDDSKVISFNSTWYLEKIESFNNTETVNFNYISGDPISVTNYSKKMKMRNKFVNTVYLEVKILWFIRLQKDSVNQTVTVEDQETWNSNIVQTISSPKYLSAITTSNESAYFYYNPIPRLDLENGKALQKIEIKDYNGQLMKIFDFYQSDQPALLTDVSETTLNQDKYRMFLDKVELKTALNNTIPLYRYKYNSTILPQRNSSKTDYWGFYNNNEHGYFPDETSVDQAKNVDVQRLKAGMLEEITFSSGGYKKFSYGSNTYYDDYGGYPVLGGGIRVEKIIEVPGLGAPKLSKYIYSTGKRLRANPVYQANIDHLQTMVPYKVGAPIPLGNNGSGIPSIPLPPHSLQNRVVGPITSPLVPSSPYAGLAGSMGQAIGNIIAQLQPIVSTHYSPFIIHSSTPYNSLNDSDGLFVGYSHVTTENSEGKTVYMFTDGDDYPDMANQIRVNSDFRPTVVLYSDIAPFAPYTSYAYARGRIKSIHYYDKNNIQIKGVTNIYTFSDVHASVPGMKCSLGIISLNGYAVTNKYYNLGRYDYVSFSLIKQETIDTENKGITTKTTTDYYTSFPFLISSLSFENSDGSTVKTDYKYVTNKNEVSYDSPAHTLAANKLYDAGVYSLLLQQTVKRDNLITNIQKIGYKNWQVGNKELVLQEIVFQGNGNSLKIVQQNFEYDQHGNLIKSKAKNTPIFSTKWGNNALFPVLEIFNADLNEVFEDDFERVNETIGDAHSGDRFHSGSYNLNFTPPNNRRYKYNYWYRLNNKWNFSGNLPYNGPITIDRGNAIDNVLVSPLDANCNTRIYHPFQGVIFTSNNNGNDSYFSYDDFNRLLLIKDKDKNIVQQYLYNDVNTRAGEVYFNDVLSQDFIKSQCDNFNEVGQIRTYTVPADRHYSYISKADANAKAQEEIDSKGQYFADLYGQCGLHAPITTNITAGSSNYSINKSFYDGKRVFCVIKAICKNIDGLLYDTYFNIQFETNQLQITGALQLQDSSIQELQLVSTTVN